jgi:cytochrome b involved in lipid metabolism
MVRIISKEECDQHNDAQGGDFWVVVESYVLDLSQFVKQHPAGARKIEQKRKELGIDITANFIDHFGHTVRTFRNAARAMEAADNEAPVTFQFRERSGANVVILGRLGLK